MAEQSGARLNLGAEVALAFTCGLALFALLSIALALADSRVLPAVALGIAGIGAVLTLLRSLGIACAVAATVAGLLAFDWFSVPPTHPHAFPDAESLVDLLVFLAAGALIGGLAARAGRRAATSERARTELADEQAALRRVATLVAEGVPASQLFHAVAQEAGGRLEVDGTYIAKYESDEVVSRAFWSKPSYQGPRFDRFKVSQSTVSGEVRRTKRPVRIDDFEKIQQTTAFAGQPVIASLVAAPIVVENQLWGVMAAWSRTEPLPADTEAHLAQFTDLVATAIANSDARAEVNRLANQQAALRRVATLVARGVSPENVFTAVATEVRRVLGVESVHLARSEADGTVTLIAEARSEDVRSLVGTRLPVDGTSVTGLVIQTERAARIDDYSTASGTMGELAKELGTRGGVGCPIVVEGRVWGVAIAATRSDEPLPADSESRIGEFTELAGTAIANASARHEIATLADEQAALRRVATLVAEGVAPGEVFAAVARELGQLLGVDSTNLARWEGDGTVTNVGGWAAHGATAPVGTRIPVDGAPVSRLVYESGRPVRIDDYEQVSGGVAEVIQDLGIQSTVGAPINVEGRAWGVMIASSNLPEPLPADTESRITAFSELVATAISNTEARSETRRLAEEQAALRRVATLVAEGVPPAEVFAAVARELGELLGVDSTHIGRYEADTAIGVGSWSVDGSLRSEGTVASLDSTSVVGMVHETGRPARLDDHQGVPGEIAAITREWGVISAVGAPIVVDGELWGVMVASSRDPAPLLADAESRITAFTELVATAISNTEARTETRRLADEQAALRRVATLVAREAPASEVFAKVAEEIGLLLGIENVWMHCYEPDDSIKVVASWGELESALPVGTQMYLDETTIAGQVRRTGRPARSERYETSVAEVAGLGLRSAVGSPIVVDGHLWGVMSAATRKAEPLPASAEAHIEEFTQLVATAISNLQARSDLAASRARILAAEDDERRRVVRDLHDGAQQRLVHTVVTLQMANRALGRESGEASPLLAEALQQAEQATEELRELAHGILPSVLTRGGLRAGVGALASRMPVPVENGVSVDRLPPDVEATAYFIVAEALTNVAKHSHAGQAVVTARTENGTLQIQVRDDGVGGAKVSGPGLVGLADRVAALDGTLRLESPADGGTLVAADIPVR